MRFLSSLLLGSAALAACNSGDVVVGTLQDVTEYPTTPNRDLDLLFVVDDSPSMRDKQVALAENFPRMIDALAALDTGLPNLHIGVVTSDMGTTGSDNPANPGRGVGSLGAGGCAGAGDDGALHGATSISGLYIVDTEDPANPGQRITNYDGSLRSAFGDIADVGADGCGFEQHLASMKRAFENPTNAGFIRPEANLAVVVLADEDDCSLHDAQFFSSDTSVFGPLQSFRCFDYGVVCDPDDPRTPGGKLNCAPRADSAYVSDVQPFIDALLAQKPDPRMIMVAGIVGPADTVSVELVVPPGSDTAIPMLSHSCSFDGPTESWVADPAVRLGAFLDAFPGRSTNQTICTDDFSGPLDGIAQTARRLVGDPCFSTDGLADTQADVPGVQPACEVIDVRDSAPDAAVSLPACGGAVTSNCYAIAADAHACPLTPDHLRVQVQRSGAVAADTWTHVRCQKAH